MKIIQYNTVLDEFTTYADQNSQLHESLEILKPKDLVESLSAYNEYSDEEYRAFRLLSANIEEGAAFGFEPFPGSFLGPLKKDVILQQDFLQLLADFYCNTYNKNFVILSHIYNASDESISVLLIVNQFS